MTVKKIKNKIKSIAFTLYTEISHVRFAILFSYDYNETMV